LSGQVHAVICTLFQYSDAVLQDDIVTLHGGGTPSHGLQSAKAKVNFSIFPGYPPPTSLKQRQDVLQEE
jgi:hypothetical protein